MLSINALSLAPGFNAWLANSRYPRILHVFDPACNLINEHREVFSVVGQQIGNGPFNIVLDEDVCFSKYLRLESPVTLSHTHLYLGDLAINTADANRWNPRPDWEKLYSRRDEILDRLMSLSVPDYQSLFPNSLVSNFSSALTTADISAARALASQLAGLGQGLTPSGDDFIMGAIYAALIIHPPKIAGALAKEIANIAAPLTTSLSAAWLSSATRGEAGVLWHDFFETLIFVAQTAFPVEIANRTYENLIQKTMDNILSIGETSGADALAGFLAVFSAYKERMIDQCPS